MEIEVSSLILFGLSALGAAAVLFIYPFAVWLRSVLVSPRDSSAKGPLPRSVSLLIVARNAEALLPRKIANSAELLLTDGRVQRVWVSDGSTDGTVDLLRREVHSPDRAVILEEHRGKAEALNRGAALCDGEIIVFSDVDALLEPETLEKLLGPFEDPAVGGVCGRRSLSRDRTDLTGAQSGYVSLGSRVKEWESRTGSITSNDGKLYAIRRTLFQPVAEAVTDDLFIALSVISQGACFVFEPEARAAIPTPSRSPGHELRRRRRVVCRSLRGLFRMRHLMNPRRTGFFAVGLFVNKVLRRGLPFFLLGLLASTIALARSYDLFRVLAILQLAMIAGAASYPLIRGLPLGPVVKIGSVLFYFCLGNLGTLLGDIDFLRGRRIVMWEPQKSGEST
jgi:cellulose synthase/poly-beta-1,6-N-acetylglucosamine synthase-like glycosyltransferase